MWRASKNSVPDEEEDGGGGPVESDPLLALVNADTLSEAHSLSVGQSVEAEEGGQWWAAKVLEVNNDGTAKIHYVGWESSYDEVVPRSRLRLPSPAPKRVAVFGDGFSFTGTLEGATEDFLAVRRDENRNRVFVQRSRITYFEVLE